MKQNERLLVYAVTGFLALILVVAVLFGNDSSRSGQSGPLSGNAGGGLKSLSDLVPSAEKKDVDGRPVGGSPVAGQPLGAQHGTGTEGSLPGSLPGGAPSGVVPPVAGQPLVARPQVAADLVAQRLGASRRDRNVRFVRAREGDSLDSLVRRWCGARDPFFAEAVCLNEELHRLLVGQEVAVPWVDDELLVAQFEQGPRVLTSGAPRELATANAAGDGAAGYGDAVPAVSGGSDGSGRIGLSPDFAMPGAGGPQNAAAGGAGVPSAGVETYTIQSGDALWKIAAKKYGAGKADRMVKEILRINPGVDASSLQIGQKLKLPAVN